MRSTQWATDQILEASVGSIRDQLDDHWDGSLGVDGTAIRTWARGVAPKNGVTATDPDAGWYSREGDHRDPESAFDAAGGAKTAEKGKRRKRRSNRLLFGYEATLAVARNPHYDAQPGANGAADPKALPALVMGMVLDKPGYNPGENGITVLDGIRRRGHPAGDVGADRLYNGSKEDTWQLPLRAMGYRPTYDYRFDQLGIQASAHGAILVEGTWYSPAMPAHLINATKDLLAPERSPNKIDPETWTKRIAAREHYRLLAKGKLDEHGYQRLQCPAARNKVQCPFKPASMGTDPSLPLADPAPSPAAPPPVCAQASVTIAPTDGAKHWQPRPYGSPNLAAGARTQVCRGIGRYR